jgi:hypothetical protein
VVDLVCGCALFDVCTVLSPTLSCSRDVFLLIYLYFLPIGLSVSLCLPFCYSRARFAATGAPFVDLAFPPLPTSLWSRGRAPPLALPPLTAPPSPVVPAVSAATAAAAAAQSSAPARTLTAQPLVFRRPSDIFEGAYAVFPASVEGAGQSSLGDVRQGLLADCWIVGALAALAAQHPKAVRALFLKRSRHASASGLYHLRLFKGTTDDRSTKTKTHGGGGAAFGNTSVAPVPAGPRFGP